MWARGWFPGSLRPFRILPHLSCSLCPRVESTEPSRGFASFCTPWGFQKYCPSISKSPVTVCLNTASGSRNCKQLPLMVCNKWLGTLKEVQQRISGIGEHGMGSRNGNGEQEWEWGTGNGKMEQDATPQRAARQACRGGLFGSGDSQETPKLSFLRELPGCQFPWQPQYQALGFPGQGRVVAGRLRSGQMTSADM